jgi:hypothetical protein
MYIGKSGCTLYEKADVQNCDSSVRGLIFYLVGHSEMYIRNGCRIAERMYMRMYMRTVDLLVE